MGNGLTAVARPHCASIASEPTQACDWDHTEEHGSKSNKTDAGDAYEDEGAVTAGSDGSDSEDMDSEWEIQPEAWSILNDMRSKRGESASGRQRPKRRLRTSGYKGLERIHGLIARDVGKAEMNASSEVTVLDGIWFLSRQLEGIPRGIQACIPKRNS